MQGILDTMLLVFDQVKECGSYLILLLAALYVLYRVNVKKNQWLICYAVLCLVFVCANPFLVLILAKAFPVLGSYETFLLFAPILFYIPLAVVELFEKIYDWKQAALLLVGILLVIGISGNLYGLYQNDTANAPHYGKEQKEMVEWISEKQPAFVAADETLLPFLRIKAPQIPLLYGRDLYQSGMDLGIIDVYGEELLHFYEAMKNPKDTLQDILATADLYGCDMVVIQSFEKSPKEMGHFIKIMETDMYTVYSVQ